MRRWVRGLNDGEGRRGGTDSNGLGLPAGGRGCGHRPHQGQDLNAL